MVDPEGGTDPPVPRKEDIPTFDEWKKKVMEVEEKKSEGTFCRKPVLHMLCSYIILDKA